MLKRTRAFSFLGITSVALVLACALGDGPATVPTSRLGSWTTIDDLERSYAAKLQGLRKERIEAIKGLIDRAMENKNLDGAIALRDRLKDAELELRATPDIETGASDLTELRSAIKDVAWKFGSESIKFKTDGSVQNEGWDSRGLKTSWQIIDRRTVLIHLDAGRTDNRLALFIYSPKIDRYQYWDFDGRKQDWAPVIKKD